jgi:hypothetical protein
MSAAFHFGISAPFSLAHFQLFLARSSLVLRADAFLDTV